jgi:DNA polymerase IIIc chi subunit
MLERVEFVSGEDEERELKKSRKKWAKYKKEEIGPDKEESKS